MALHDSSKSQNNNEEVVKVGVGGCPVKHGSNVMGVEVKKNGSTSSSGSRCPVNRNNSNDTSSKSRNESSWMNLSNWWKQSNDFNNIKNNKIDQVTKPNSLEEAAKHAQTPMADQMIPLSTHRVVSSIPKGDDDTIEQPHHQAGDNSSKSRWVYPSEQQFYNAMRRKGWEGVDESTIPFVVRIHNEVNERGWKEVCRWERELHNNHSPKLVKFMGRPNDLSPKAFFFCRLLRFYKDPFDRHDWYVQTSTNNDHTTPPRRYVIDFYNGNQTSSSATNPTTSSQQPPSMYIDVRPAIDSPDAMWDRLRMTARETFPGIFNALSSSNIPTSGSINSSNNPTSTTPKTQASE